MASESEKKGEIAPAKLASKLKQIRLSGGLTQGKMLKIIHPSESNEINRARISQYELGTRIPSLTGIFSYAQFAGVTVEALIDDKIDLPKIGEGNRNKRNKSFVKRTKSAADENRDGNEINKVEENKPENSAASKLEKQVLPESSVFDGVDLTDVSNFCLPDEPHLKNSLLSEDGQASNHERDEFSLNSADVETTITITLSDELTHSCKTAYLDLLGRLPFHKMKLLTPDRFTEKLIKAALEDYIKHPDESAFGRCEDLI